MVFHFDHSFPTQLKMVYQFLIFSFLSTDSHRILSFIYQFEKKMKCKRRSNDLCWLWIGHSINKLSLQIVEFHQIKSNQIKSSLFFDIILVFAVSFWPFISNSIGSGLPMFNLFVAFNRLPSNFIIHLSIFLKNEM